jgi:hypothetical protein
LDSIPAILDSGDEGTLQNSLIWNVSQELNSTLEDELNFAKPTDFEMRILNHMIWDIHLLFTDSHFPSAHSRRLFEWPTNTWLSFIKGPGSMISVPSCLIILFSTISPLMETSVARCFCRGRVIFWNVRQLACGNYCHDALPSRWISSGHAGRLSPRYRIGNTLFIRSLRVLSGFTSFLKVGNIKQNEMTYRERKLWSQNKIEFLDSKCFGLWTMVLKAEHGRWWIWGTGNENTPIQHKQMSSNRRWSDPKCNTAVFDSAWSRFSRILRSGWPFVSIWADYFDRFEFPIMMKIFWRTNRHCSTL